MHSSTQFRAQGLLQGLHSSCSGVARPRPGRPGHPQTHSLTVLPCVAKCASMSTGRHSILTCAGASAGKAAALQPPALWSARLLGGCRKGRAATGAGAGQEGTRLVPPLLHCQGYFRRCRCHCQQHCLAPVSTDSTQHSSITHHRSPLQECSHCTPPTDTATATAIAPPAPSCTPARLPTHLPSSPAPPASPAAAGCE